MKRRGILTTVGAVLTAGCVETGTDGGKSSSKGTGESTGSASSSATPTDRSVPTRTREPSPTPTESPTPTPDRPENAAVVVSNERDHRETVSIRVTDTGTGAVLLDETVTVTPPGSRSWQDLVEPGTTVRVSVQVTGGDTAEETFDVRERRDGRTPAGIYVDLEGGAKYDDISFQRPDL